MVLFLEDVDTKEVYLPSGKKDVSTKLIGEYPVKSSVISANNVLFVNDTIPLNDIQKNGGYTVRLILQYTDKKGKLKNIIKENQFKIDNLDTTQI